jgi:hypothetical protein
MGTDEERLDYFIEYATQLIRDSGEQRRVTDNLTTILNCFIHKYRKYGIRKGTFGLGITQVNRETGIPWTTCKRLVQALEQLDIIKQVKAGDPAKKMAPEWKLGELSPPDSVFETGATEPAVASEMVGSGAPGALELRELSLSLIKIQKELPRALELLRALSEGSTSAQKSGDTPPVVVPTLKVVTPTPKVEARHIEMVTPPEKVVKVLRIEMATPASRHFEVSQVKYVTPEPATKPPVSEPKRQYWIMESDGTPFEIYAENAALLEPEMQIFSSKDAVLKYIRELNEYTRKLIGSEKIMD